MKLQTFLAELKFAGYQVRTGKIGNVTQYLVAPDRPSEAIVAFWWGSDGWIVASRNARGAVLQDFYDTLEDAAERVAEIMRDG